MASGALPAFDPRARFGAHMGTTGGLHTAAYAARAAGCDHFQVFTKSPQQWKAKELTDAQVEQFLEAQRETSIPCVAAHDTYLINPCSADEEILRKSREALVDELARSTRLRIPYVVMHCGTPGDCLAEEGADRLADTLSWILERAPGDGSVLLLETMAGQGKCIGHQFEHLARVLERVGAPGRLQVCWDTCHVFAAGYDFRTPETCADTLERFDSTVGLRHVRLIHANDSKRELGSRVDRHEHIGQGQIGLEGFRLLLNDPRLRQVPVILETPKAGDMDPVNLDTLRGLVA